MYIIRLEIQILIFLKNLIVINFIFKNIVQKKNKKNYE
jgi:hypothetical protein